MKPIPLLLFLAVSMASSAGMAQSLDIDLSSLGAPAAARSGTLVFPSGEEVNWTVDGGHWELITVPAAGDAPYSHYTVGNGSTGVQNWTFAASSGLPVDLAFSMGGLNCANEGITFSSGTELAAALPSANLNWDAATFTLSHNNSSVANNGALASDFTLSEANALTLTSVGGGGCRRGLTALSVTLRTPPAAAAPTPVPLNNAWALALLSAMLCGAAGFNARRKQRR